MELLNIETETIDLIISYESQKVKKLKCKMNDKIEDVLSEFASKEKVDYASFLILYSGLLIQGPDLKKTFFQTMTKNDKEQRTMNLLIYSKNPAVISGQKFIKIILIINSKDVFELQGKKNETIKEIINKNYSKIGININSLIIKYDMNEIDLNKKFDEIANPIDKKHSGMTLQAYTNDNNKPLTVIFVDENNQRDIVECQYGDKIRDVVKKCRLIKGRNIYDFLYKYDEFNLDDADLKLTFMELFHKIGDYNQTNFKMNVENNNSLSINIKDINEIQIKIERRISCCKKNKNLIIIISTIIFILLISSIIIYKILPKKPNPPTPEPDPSIINDTIIESYIINDTIKESTQISQSQTIENSYIKNTIEITYTIIQSILETFKITDTTKETTIDSTNKKPKVCESGYYIPDNDLTLEDCQKCSIEGCIKCHGSYESNICTDCGSLKSVYNNNHNKIIGCVNSCKLGEEENCLSCNEDTLECTSCNIGYKLVNGKCRPDHFIKAIYKTNGDGEIVKLFVSNSAVNKLIIDGENVPVKNEYQFPKNGNHTVYIKFIKSTYEIISTPNYFFNENKKLISAVFSDFDEYISEISFKGMFRECTNLISVDLSKISLNLNSEFYSMFSGCINLTHVDFNFKKFVLARNTLSEMFLNCTLLTSLDLSKLNVSKVTSFSNMFTGCKSLRKINLNSFKLDSVNSIASMFKNCVSLEYLDLSSFKPYKLTNMDSLFYNCNSLTSIKLDNFFTSKVTSMELLFYNCSSLKLINLTSFNTESVTIMNSMFERCTSLTSIIFGNNFNTNNVIRMGSFFADCHSMKSIDYPLTITKKLANITYFFSNCYSLTSINFNNFDTSNIYYFNNMFRNCYNLTNINTSYFRIINRVNINYMFMGCYSLTSIDFPLYYVSHINYEGAFFNCPNLKFINFSSVDNSDVYYPLFNSNISSNGTLILNEKLYNSQKKYLNVPSNWTLKLI